MADSSGTTVRRTYPIAEVMVRSSVLLTAVCVPLAIWIALGGLPAPVGQEPLEVAVGCVLLVAAFAAAELFPFRIEVRRETRILSLSELPLVLGFLLLPAWAVVASHFVGGCAVYIGRRDHWRHGLTNTVMTLVESVAAVGVMELVGTIFSISPMGEPAVLAGVLAGALASALGINTILLLAGPTEPFRVVMGRTIVSAATVMTFALVIRTVWVSGTLGPILGVIVILLFLLLFRVFRSLMGNKDDMAAMYAFVQSVATMQTKSAGWPQMLELIRENQNAGQAIIYLDTGEPMLRAQAVDPDGGIEVPAMSPRDPILIQAAELGVARVSQARTSRPPLLESLRDRGARDLMVVALRADHRIRGYLEVRDRRSRWGRFTDRDMRSLETLSGHVATALDNVRLVERLRDEAQNDSVTGLRNHVGLEFDLQQAESQDGFGALVLIRLGVLSTVNGAIGYERGYDLLHSAGARMTMLRPAPLAVARLEGDRFAVLLPPMSEPEVVTAVTTLLASLAGQFDLDGVDVEPDPVAGIALSSARGRLKSMDPASVEQRAEMALNAAQDRGEPFAVYRSTMGEVFRRRFQLVTQFRSAVEAGQILVYYQPKLSLKTDLLDGVEALVRWDHPEFGMVSPGEFVPAIEATAFVQLLLEHVIDTVLAQMRTWTAKGLHIPVAINLSVRNLTEEFPSSVERALQAHAMPASMLSFEVTESSVMDDPEGALPVLHALHDLGVKLSIDDFGTGYSSLAYLRKLPIDEIKIDRTFVWGMSTGINDLAIVRSIIDLGHSLGKTVVAEGVEDEASREDLRAMECDVMQGFLLGRPLPAVKFEEWISARLVATAVLGSDVPGLKLV